MHFAYTDWLAQSWLSAHIPLFDLYMVNVFAGKQNFCLNKAKKEKKNVFLESLDQCRRLEVR